MLIGLLLVIWSVFLGYSFYHVSQYGAEDSCIRAAVGMTVVIVLGLLICYLV